jgi:hypothetical protein
VSGRGCDGPDCPAAVQKPACSDRGPCLTLLQRQHAWPPNTPCAPPPADTVPRCSRWAHLAASVSSASLTSTWRASRSALPPASSSEAPACSASWGAMQGVRARGWRLQWWRRGRRPAAASLACLVACSGLCVYLPSCASPCLLPPPSLGTQQTRPPPLHQGLLPSQPASTACAPPGPHPLARSHLTGHPQVQRPSNKEPEFFTRKCSYNAMRCVTSQQRMYMRDVSGRGRESAWVF